MSFLSSTSIFDPIHLSEVLLTTFAILLIQLILCFRAKSLGIRLALPVGWMVAASVCALGWGLTFFTMLGGTMAYYTKLCLFQILVSGLGWLIWWLVTLVRKPGKTAG